MGISWDCIAHTSAIAQILPQSFREGHCNYGEGIGVSDQGGLKKGQSLRGMSQIKGKKVRLGWGKIPLSTLSIRSKKAHGYLNL